MAARLSFDERARIEALRTVGFDAQQIARQLGRDPSTIYREQNAKAAITMVMTRQWRSVSRICGHVARNNPNSLRILSWLRRCMNGR